MPNGVGVSVSGEDVVIRTNLVSQNTGSGVLLNGTNVVLRGLNTITGNGSHGIEDSGTGNTIVQTLDRSDIPDDIAPTTKDKLILINEIKQGLNCF